MANSKSQIYTKSGDRGQTSLLGGKRVSKAHAKIETYGEVDNLNALLGVLVSSLSSMNVDEHQKFLQHVQNNLFVIGSYLACEEEKRDQFHLIPIAEEEVEKIEVEIDALEASLDELKNFILPGGAMPSSFAHLCRTQTRKVERLLIENNYTSTNHGYTVAYFNRLSDYFFVLSRHINHSQNIADIIWKQ